MVKTKIRVEELGGGIGAWETKVAITDAEDNRVELTVEQSADVVRALLRMGLVRMKLTKAETSSISASSSKVMRPYVEIEVRGRQGGILRCL